MEQRNWTAIGSGESLPSNEYPSNAKGLILRRERESEDHLLRQFPER